MTPLKRERRVCVCYRRDGEPLTERHVQAVWYDRALRPDGMRTCDGEPLRVIHPGVWNLGPGPDFRGAVLQIGSRRIAGDVEMHLTPSDWDAHRHGDDPEYASVVAHVTWNSGPVPASLPSGAVSVWIGHLMTADVGFSPDQIDLTAYPFARLPAEDRPCQERLRFDPDVSDAVLTAAGAYRLQAKARRLSRLLGAPGRRREEIRRELFYAETMGALGYGGNSRAFRAVAEAVPLSALVAEPDNAEAALLSAAQFVQWNRRGLRPNNFPERRLAAAARLFTATDVFSLLSATDFAPAQCKAMLSTLAAKGVMGRGRAAAVFANIAVPFAIADGRIVEPPDWLPPEEISAPVRLTAFRMFGRDHNPSTVYAGNGLKIQGLIQIHRDYCLRIHPNCGECGLVASLPPAMDTAAG